MMLAMNQMGYDAMVVGNHEYNFGLGTSPRPAGRRASPGSRPNTHDGTLPPSRPTS